MKFSAPTGFAVVGPAGLSRRISTTNVVLVRGVWSVFDRRHARTSTRPAPRRGRRGCARPMHYGETGNVQPGRRRPVKAAMTDDCPREIGIGNTTVDHEPAPEHESRIAAALEPHEVRRATLCGDRPLTQARRAAPAPPSPRPAVLKPSRDPQRRRRRRSQSHFSARNSKIFLITSTSG